MSFLLPQPRDEKLRLLGDGLRRLYEDTVREPIPQRFTDLLARLK